MNREVPCHRFIFIVKFGLEIPGKVEIPPTSDFGVLPNKLFRCLQFSLELLDFVGWAIQLLVYLLNLIDQWSQFVDGGFEDFVSALERWTICRTKNHSLPMLTQKPDTKNSQIAVSASQLHCLEDEGGGCGIETIPTITTKTGANVSRLWRGVTKQWGSILEGIEWRLGNGVNTKFWHDRWVNGCDALIKYAFTSPNIVDLNGTVNEFTTASGEWDWRKFEYLSPAHVCSKIASMVPPGKGSGKDVPAWRFSKDGSFSVKTAYKSLSNHEDIPKEPIWSWQGPQRIKSFLWLCGHDKVLSNVAHKHRGMTEEDGCAKCGESQEDLLHFLKDCSNIKNVWLRLVKSKHWLAFFNLNLREWLLFSLSRNLGHSDTDWNILFGATCWKVWKWRNDFIFNNGKSSVGDPVLHIQQYCRFVISAFSSVDKERQNRRAAVKIAWKPPPEEWVKINVDGSVDPSSFGSSACGGVLRDRDGNFLCGFIRNVGSCSIILADLWGILSGLQVAWNRGFKKVILETDSLNAERLIHQAFEEGHCSAQLVQGIHKLMAQEWEVVIQHVYREANFVADRLAQLGHYENFSVRIIEQPPDCIHNLLYEDVHGRGVLRTCVV
ncbi:putative ribonuclease H protein At1g65750 family [Senna tora]|uniref:Putative ribonuclease H protein At1g65750 family n=1 Tax=Senna tora TaxID=362788 RepID=A0A834T4K6_9FABA|nr:putative ribonuclease H protein At1g65750 family [Senna tora]